MDLGNGWNAGGYPRADQDATILNRIMLKFRPIAPKPAVAGSASASAQEDNKTGDVTKRRSKRKYVRVKKKVSKCYSSPSKNNNNENRREEEEEERRNPSGVDTSLLTLQLLPESSGSSSTSTAVDSPKKGCFEKMLNFSSAHERPMWMYLDNHRNNDIGGSGWADQTDRRRGLRVVESWVMVEGMTKTWVDGGGLGNSDMEKMRNLEVDTCPGLISDGLDRVQWVNLAYRRMVDPHHGGGEAPVEVVAQLVVKEKIPIRTALPAAFACTVRVVYRRQSGKHTQTMPCDVWKMDFGGFAWRFDAKAALCLGR